MRVQIDADNLMPGGGQIAGDPTIAGTGVQDGGTAFGERVNSTGLTVDIVSGSFKPLPAFSIAFGMRGVLHGLTPLIEFFLGFSRRSRLWSGSQRERTSRVWGGDKTFIGHVPMVSALCCAVRSFHGGQDFRPAHGTACSIGRCLSWEILEGTELCDLHLMATSRWEIQDTASHVR